MQIRGVETRRKNFLSTGKTRECGCRNQTTGYRRTKNTGQGRVRADQEYEFISAGKDKHKHREVFLEWMQLANKISTVISENNICKIRFEAETSGNTLDECASLDSSDVSTTT